MSLQNKLDVLKRISEVAALAGLRGQIHEDTMRFGMGFNLPEGRSQVVYVRQTAQALDGKTVVTFMSPCLVIKKGLLAGISKETAIELLQLNENVLFARYGIVEFDKETLVVASADHLLDTLDPEEFNASAWHVAFAADQYERKHGRDDF